MCVSSILASPWQACRKAERNGKALSLLDEMEVSSVLALAYLRLPLPALLAGVFLHLLARTNRPSTPLYACGRVQGFVRLPEIVPFTVDQMTPLIETVRFKGCNTEQLAEYQVKSTESHDKIDPISQTRKICSRCEEGHKHQCYALRKSLLCTLLPYDQISREHEQNFGKEHRFMLRTLTTWRQYPEVVLTTHRI